MNFKKCLASRKTYLSAIGLLGLGIYYLTQQQLEPALGCFAAALTALGVHHDCANPEPAPPPTPEPPAPQKKE